MKKLKIRGKLTLGFGLLLIIIIVMNAFSLSNLRGISNLSVDLYTGPHMSALSSVALLKDVYKIENAADQMLLAADGKLTEITERVRIEKRADGPAYTEDDGATWTPLAGDTVVSMNMWGFTNSMLPEIRDRFAAFLSENLSKNPLKCEYFLPFVVDELIREDKAEVTVADGTVDLTLYKELRG